MNGSEEQPVTLTQLREVLGEERVFLQEQLNAERLFLQEQFHAERAYYRQLIRDELQDIRERIDRLAERTHEESTLAFTEIEAIKKRLDHAERELAQLKH